MPITQCLKKYCRNPFSHLSVVLWMQGRRNLILQVSQLDSTLISRHPHAALCHKQPDQPIVLYTHLSCSQSPAFSHLPLKVPYFFSFCPVSFYLLTLASYINVRCLIHSKQDNSKGQAQYSSVFTMLSFSSVFSWEYLANLITKGNVCNVSVIWWPGCIWPESDPKFTNTTKWIGYYQ